MKKRIQILITMLAMLALSPLNFSTALAQGTTGFTYQGQLRDNATNANGTYTMIFKLYDAATNGNQISSAVTNSPALANGLFTVNLDFGAGAFDGSARWLDITVTNGPNSQTLSPRLLITPTPYALFALNGPGGVGGGNLVATNLALKGGGKTWNLTVDANGTLTIADNKWVEVTTLAATYFLPGVYTEAVSFVKGAIFSEAVTFVTDAIFGGQVEIGDWSIYTTPPSTGNPLYFVQDGTTQFTLQSKYSTDPFTHFPHAGTFNGMVDALVFGINAWRITTETVSPPGLGTINSALTFSAAGTPLMAIDPITGDMWINSTHGLLITASGSNGLTVPYIHATKAIDVDGTLYANADLRGNNANLDNITARGSITAAGRICANNGVDCISDRNAKENFVPINTGDVLERIVQLPMTRWNYKTDPHNSHIGPMAQDFYAAFNVGPDDKHISTVDEGGVALAAIQGLNEKLKDKDAKIDALEKRLADLETLLKSQVSKQTWHH
jgi:hypothetical protein